MAKGTVHEGSSTRPCNLHGNSEVAREECLLET